MGCSRILASAVLIMCAAGHVSQARGAATEHGKQEQFDVFVDQLAAEWMRADPTGATARQYFAGAAQDALDRQLTAKDFQYGIPFGKAAKAACLGRARRGLGALSRYRRGDLTPVQRASAASLEWELTDAVQMTAVADHRFVFEQFGGLQVSLVNFLSQIHPIRNARDVDNYLARLRQLASVLDQGIVEAQARAQEGIVPPKFILQSTIDGIDRFLSPEPSKNVLVTSLQERAQTLNDLSEGQRATAVTAAERILRGTVLPAFRRVRALLAAQMLEATDDAGLWRLPQGAQAYTAMLRVNTTTDMTPDKIHDLGLREVARVEGEMDHLLRALGYDEGSVQQRYKALEASVQPPSDPDPRAAVLAEHTRILRDAEQRAQTLFDLQPKAPVRVLREPPFTENTAAAHYSAPAPDGSLPGTVWIPLPGPTFKILEMRTLTYHEGVPGHHFQVALQQELPQIPRFRQKRVFGNLSSFTEGWALYAELLAAEAGWYEGDAKGRLGQLYDELFRARRLVVDTGLHAKHWTRQQAIDYGISVAEVERYVAMPGQACAYKIGELEILTQRSKAQSALGPKFSMKEFHNLVLQTGSVPLAVLGQVVDGYIASAMATPRDDAQAGR